MSYNEMLKHKKTIEICKIKDMRDFTWNGSDSQRASGHVIELQNITVNTNL